MKMSEPKLAASQPDITTWLSGALETLIQLESGRNVEGLAIGKAYDCRASAMTARGASNDSKPVRVMGAD